MSTEEEVLSLEDEREKFRFIKVDSTSFGRRDRSGVHFILSLVAIFLLIVAVANMLQIAVDLKLNKSAEVFSLTHDLATFPNGNSWIVAGIALVIYVRCFIWLVTAVCIGGFKILIEIQAGNYLMVITRGAYQLLQLFMLFMAIIVGFLFL